MEPRRAAWVTPVGVSPDPRARPEQVTFFRRHVNTSTTNKRFPTIRVLVVSWRLPVPGWVPGWDAGLSLSRWVGKVPEVLGAFPAKESGPARPPPPLFPPMHTGNEGEKSQFFWDRAMPASGKPSPPPSSGQDFGDCLWAAVTGGGRLLSSGWVSVALGPVRHPDFGLRWFLGSDVPAARHGTVVQSLGAPIPPGSGRGPLPLSCRVRDRLRHECNAQELAPSQRHRVLHRCHPYFP